MQRGVLVFGLFIFKMESAVSTSTITTSILVKNKSNGIYGATESDSDASILYGSATESTDSYATIVYNATMNSDPNATIVNNANHPHFIKLIFNASFDIEYNVQLYNTLAALATQNDTFFHLRSTPSGEYYVHSVCGKVHLRQVGFEISCAMDRLGRQIQHN